MPPAEPPSECWLHPDVVVGLSPIAGRGLFATAPIAAGEAVSRVGGRLVSTADLDELVRTGDTYVDSITVEEDLQLVLPPMTANHFANHSCDPTTWWVDEYTLVARTEIAEGEELTNDYATSSNHPGFVMYCHCETYRCRQVIEGNDWTIPQLQQRYAGHWVPHLQRLIDATAQGVS
ncbi:MAG: SET domain-containing protein [Jatrophihabitantaceae bacterium]